MRGYILAKLELWTIDSRCKCSPTWFTGGVFSFEWTRTTVIVGQHSVVSTLLSRTREWTLRLSSFCMQGGHRSSIWLGERDATCQSKLCARCMRLRQRSLTIALFAPLWCLLLPCTYLFTIAYRYLEDRNGVRSCLGHELLLLWALVGNSLEWLYDHHPSWRTAASVI